MCAGVQRAEVNLGPHSSVIVCFLLFVWGVFVLLGGYFCLFVSFFEAGSLIDLELAYQAKLADQQTPGPAPLHLSRITRGHYASLYCSLC